MTGPTGDLTAERANVRAEEYFLAQAWTICRACGSECKALALALPAGHQRRVDPYPDGEAGSGIETDWEHAGMAAFLFFVRAVTMPVRNRCRESSQHFQMTDGAAGVRRYWANHCGRCRARLDDDELHGEPDAAFIPTSPERARRIRLVRIREPFEAIAEGYALEPQFFDQMAEG